MKNKTELWDLYTAIDEYSSIFKDKYNRITSYEVRKGSVFKPGVSEYLLKNGLKPHYPDNKKFAMALTHDIDKLFYSRAPKQVLKRAVTNLANLNSKQLGLTIKTAVKRKIVPDFHVSKILAHGKKYNSKSSFYFLALSGEEKDFNYDLSELGEVFNMIKENNGEIGLHGGHLAYNDIKKIKEEKEKLEMAIGQPVHGYRNHYLKFSTPTTWEYLDELSFKYDTTYGFAECAGFRNGMCHPFQPFSITKNSFLDIIELPLIIMDCSLWKYMNLDAKNQYELCKMLIDKVAINNGVLTLLWHNTEMTGYEGQLYEAILKYASEKGGWMTTANEIVDFWKQNQFHETAKQILEHLRTKA